MANAPIIESLEARTFLSAATIISSADVQLAGRRGESVVIAADRDAIRDAKAKLTQDRQTLTAAIKESKAALKATRQADLAAIAATRQKIKLDRVQGNRAQAKIDRQQLRADKKKLKADLIAARAEIKSDKLALRQTVAADRLLIKQAVAKLKADQRAGL